MLEIKINDDVSHLSEDDLAKIRMSVNADLMGFDNEIEGKENEH